MREEVRKGRTRSKRWGIKIRAILKHWIRSILITLSLVLLIVAGIWLFRIYKYARASTQWYMEVFQRQKSVMTDFAFRGIVIRKEAPDYLIAKLSDTNVRPGVDLWLYLNYYELGRDSLLKVEVSQELFDNAMVGDTICKTKGSYDVSIGNKISPLLSREVGKWLP